ncbi:lipopolysaccharide biosynthesis protein [Bacteroides sp. GD17]|uniref:lipopolysaccharide biosynthesis protein n=1 Tax=Bacteroides sp. GD17 TaxID=3139826 RepID=UPI00313E47D6
MEKSLQAKTINGVIWSGIERFSLQGVQFLINIVMARILQPSDYGMIGMLAVFLQISQAFIDSGFTSALIQQKERTEVDYSTVFYFNVVLSVFFYIAIFLGAPLIASFYYLPALVPVTRVVAVSLIISSLSAIHKTKLTIDIDFRTQSKVSLLSAIASGGIGIIMAYNGFGVWALVYQTLINVTLQTFFLYYYLHWMPTCGFSVMSFKKLFSFGSKLLISGLIHKIYYNLYGIVIGRKFSVVDLGYYTRAEQFAFFLSSNINAVISRVMYPILSLIQDDDKRLSSAYRKYINFASFIIFPLMVGLAALSSPLVDLLLTDKWMMVVPLLQILCLDWMFDHLSVINQNLLYVKGRSDLALKVEIIKKTIATTILFLSIPFGIIGMCWGRVLYSLIAVYLNAYYTKKLIGLSFWMQMKDIAPSLFIAFLMGGLVYPINRTDLDSYLQLLVGFIGGVFFYFSAMYIFQRNLVLNFLQLIKRNR